MMSCEQMDQSIFYEDSSPSEMRLFTFTNTFNNFQCEIEDIVERMNREQTHPFSTKDVQQRKARDKAQEVKLTKRVNNTIFKTSLSQYRKSIIDQINTRSSLQWLRNIIQDVCGAKNQSVFPKLHFMVRQLHLQQVINERWDERSLKLLRKKEELMNQGKYQSLRYHKLQETINNMNLCMKQEDFQKGFETYWGNYRQYSKHLVSKQEVLKFCKNFKTTANLHQSQKQVNSQLKDVNHQKNSTSSKKTKRAKSKTL